MQQTPTKNLLLFCDKMIRKYTPDPFSIAVVLTLVAMFVATWVTPSHFYDLIGYWGDGFWSLTSFTLQMAMILLGGYILAVSKPIRALLTRFCSLAKTPHQAIALTSLLSCFVSWLNWGFGLVLGAFVALEMSKKHRRINFPLLVATAYSGFVVWHGGLSGSIPLLLNTNGNFSFNLIGSTLPLRLTLFSPLNISILLALFVVLPILSYFLSAKSQFSETQLEVPRESSVELAKADKLTPADRLENNFLPALVLFLFATGVVYHKVKSGKFALDLNEINFILFFSGVLCHGNLRNFVNAAAQGAGKLGPILIQYPLYAGLMMVLKQSGLAQQISQFFVEIASAKTLPLFTFFSAGLVNIFVPSGGGQWAVQGPIVLTAAKQLGANLATTSMAVAWGDAWTNLLQPFWALPLLAIANLKIKDILGYCLIYLVASGVVIAGFFLLF